MSTTRVLTPIDLAVVTSPAVAEFPPRMRRLSMDSVTIVYLINSTWNAPFIAGLATIVLKASPMIRDTGR